MKMSENRKHEATLREINLSRLRHEIEKLNRRARKLGIPELTINELSRKQQEIRREVSPGVWKDTGVYETLVTIQVVGETPKLEGWEFLGTLDHAAGDTIVRNVPGTIIPSEYWGADRVGICDHCGANRRRKETFVVRNIETGETKQVGRQCVADFLGGKSVEAAIAIASWVRGIGKVLDDEDLDRYEYGGCLWREPVLIDAAVALSTSVRVVNEYGFMSRSKATGYDTTTSDRVSHVLWPPFFRGMSERERAEIKAELDRCTPTDADKQKAAIIRDWVIGLDSTGNSYLNNLQVIMKREMVQPREIGILASVVPFYFREIENPNYQNKEKAPVSEHIGTVGDRMDIEVECVGIGSFVGTYGETTIYRLKSGNNKLTWFASGESDIEIGGKYKVKGTIKKHDEYRGEAVTMINRVKVLAVISNGAEVVTA
jgi:hypothetical protein